jgi:hypothetical protein
MWNRAGSGKWLRANVHSGSSTLTHANGARGQHLLGCPAVGRGDSFPSGRQMDMPVPLFVQHRFVQTLQVLDVPVDEISCMNISKTERFLLQKELLGSRDALLTTCRQQN